MTKVMVKDGNVDGALKRLKVDREKYNDIICPYCKTSAIIDKRDNTNYGLKILNCKNFHYGQEISYNEYDRFNVRLKGEVYVFIRSF